jgi:hypothetical protein
MREENIPKKKFRNPLGLAEFKLLGNEKPTSV